MKLYLTAAGIYAGTQQEAKRDGKGWTVEEVPVSKYELIDYLNKLKYSTKPTLVEAMDEVREHKEELLEPLRLPSPVAHLPVSYSQTDIEQRILDADATELGCYASKVAARFKEIVDILG